MRKEILKHLHLVRLTERQKVKLMVTQKVKSLERVMDWLIGLEIRSEKQTLKG
jgi:hypothetical protein